MEILILWYLQKWNSEEKFNYRDALENWWEDKLLYNILWVNISWN